MIEKVYGLNKNCVMNTDNRLRGGKDDVSNGKKPP